MEDFPHSPGAKTPSPQCRDPWSRDWIPPGAARVSHAAARDPMHERGPVQPQKQINIFLKEGLENMQARHKKHSCALRAAIKAIGLKSFVEDDSIASCAITSILPPENISVPDIRATLKNDFDIVVANGQNDLKDKIFRMGTLGFVCDRDVLASISALEATLFKLGHKFELGNGVKAAIEILTK